MIANFHHSMLPKFQSTRLYVTFKPNPQGACVSLTQIQQEATFIIIGNCNITWSLLIKPGHQDRESTSLSFCESATLHFRVANMLPQIPTLRPRRKICNVDFYKYSEMWSTQNSRKHTHSLSNQTKDLMQIHVCLYH